MFNSKQIIEAQTGVMIPLHGDFKLYRWNTVLPGPRVVESYMAAEEFRDLAVEARRKAQLLIQAADEMDAWMARHV